VAQQKRAQELEALQQQWQASQQQLQRQVAELQEENRLLAESLKKAEERGRAVQGLS
jgi:hypothetical protein